MRTPGRQTVVARGKVPAAYYSPTGTRHGLVSAALGALYWAVLEDAWRCVQRCGPLESGARHGFVVERRKDRLFREALAWFYADDWDHAFSFQNVCFVLGLDPEATRARLCPPEVHHAAA